MPDSEESDFNFDFDESDITLPHPKNTRKYERNCAWTFQDRWHCPCTTVGAERIEVSKDRFHPEFKRRIMHNG